jgi:hypothetical protein
MAKAAKKTTVKRKAPAKAKPAGNPFAKQSKAVKAAAAKVTSAVNAFNKVINRSK